jgi:hypothetical protein
VERHEGPLRFFCHPLHRALTRPAQMRIIIGAAIAVIVIIIVVSVVKATKH